MDDIRENTEPQNQPSTNPDTTLLDARISHLVDERLEALIASKKVSLSGGGKGGGHGSKAAVDDERLRKIESDVQTLKGSVDWAKIVFTTLLAVVLGGFALLTTITLNVSVKLEGISGKIAEEFRAQRLEEAAQISAISNSISATKQQAPQVILLPPASGGNGEKK